jgi:hypothetical protein
VKCFEIICSCWEYGFSWYWETIRDWDFYLGFKMFLVVLGGGNEKAE